ncbi:uncharacterized protein J7T54_000064 [Emericellopsis cladophorae]|uniref:Uncharacterized protein n=1 Tax=Emericellopsis cladophorae TaxID=2686198 RepID=A0A9P9XYY5_9HYPO|nr:uncharacterized protein J7T54_000064 [Emericellopsis cladophorae]KAI6780158.1 hypothetical protein J7T54_000064 [Emericellopsis cladophorae]
METLQLSMVLADLSNLGAAEPEAAAAIVSAHKAAPTDIHESPSAPTNQQLKPPRPSSALQRAWSSDGMKVDKFGRRIMITPPSHSNANTAPGTPRHGEPERRLDDDLERASTLMALYDIRAKLKQQDNMSLNRAREKINSLAAKQQAHQAAERQAKAADQLRKNRYSFPKPGL